MDLKQNAEAAEWIYQVQDRILWRVLTAMNVRLHEKLGIS
jgi:hypothetical protein